MYDYIVIGGGISGLYFALRKTGKILILEKNNRLGGRSVTVPFGDQNVRIPLGTGIGIASKDHLLLKLMHDLNFNYSSYFVNVHSEQCLSTLKKLYDNFNQLEATMTFLEYMKKVLTIEEVVSYQLESGYTDFQDANAFTTMLYYGLEDNCTNYLALSIDWTNLIDAMSKYCDYKLNHEVISIKGKYPYFIIETNKGSFKHET